jgi:hypothetical protein
MSMAERPHGELEELIVAEALDGLDQGDADRLTMLLDEHGPDCLTCRALISGYREAAGHLALVVDPVPMSAGAEDALLLAATGRRPEPQGPAEPGEPPAPESIAERRRPRRPIRWVAAAAIAAALAVLGGVIGRQLAPAPAPIRTVALQPFEAPVEGQLTLVYQPGETEAVLVGTGLADPGAGKVYELWYRPSPDAKMVSAGVFRPTDGAVGGAPVTVGESFDLVAVTIEPGPNGSPTGQPSQDPILAAPVAT